MTEQHYRMTLSDAIALYSYKFGVIYRVYCEKTNFSYVGQTKDVYNGNTGNIKGLSRIKTHYNALKKGCHPCLKLQAAWDGTKGKSIKHEILEIIPREDESDWIFRKKLLSAEKPWQEVYKHHEELAPVRHYALKAAELKELKSAGILNNATFVYFALKLKNPWCDRPLRIKPLELSVEWDVPESSIYEAIAKLKASELISIDQAEIIIRWQNDSQQDSHSDNPESITESQNGFRDSRIDSEIPECVMENQNGFRDSRIDSDSSENRQPEAAPDKGSTIPHTIQTYSDFKKTLSDSEREEFLKFGENRAGELKNPPVQLPQKWIEANWEELSAQWYKSTGKVSPAQSSIWVADPRRQEWLDKIRSLGFAAFIYENGDLDKERKEFYEWANSNNVIWGDEA